MNASGEREPLFIAHRAGNSLRTLRQAEAAGAGIVELDVFQRGERVEVRHSKTVGRLPLLWDRWRLERGWGRRLLLEDVLAAAAPTTRLMIDIKRQRPGLSERIARTMDARWPGREYLVCSQDWAAIDVFEGQKQATQVYSVGSEPALAQFLRRFPEGGLTHCSIHERFVDARSAAALVARTELVMSWPVNEPSRLAQLASMGVQGMITDRLDLITAQTG